MFFDFWYLTYVLGSTSIWTCQISNICLGFFNCADLKKTITTIRNSKFGIWHVQINELPRSLYLFVSRLTKPFHYETDLKMGWSKKPFPIKIDLNFDAFCNNVILPKVFYPNKLLTKIAFAWHFLLYLAISDNLLPVWKTMALLLSKQHFVPMIGNPVIWKGIHLENNH